MDLSAVFKLLVDFIGLTILPFVIVLGILIFAHELGHFLAARIVGVRVLMFKLGFGRYILSFKRGHTEYGVGWIPIGGYVKMFGDPTEIEGGKEDGTIDDIPEEDRAEALYFRPAGHKLFVFIAGPFMNIVLAFLIAPLVYLIGVERPQYPEGPLLIHAVEEGSAAAAAGIKPGDRILAVDGNEYTTYEKLRIAEAISVDTPMTYRVDRGGEIIEIEVTPREDEESKIGVTGLVPPPLPVLFPVQDVISGSAGEAAGIKAGDTILLVNGETSTQEENKLSLAAENNEGKPIMLDILRDGRPISIGVVPKFDEKAGKPLIGIQYGRAFRDTEIVRFGLMESVKKGADDCVYYADLTLRVFWKLISGQLSPKTMAGPLGIGAITSAAAHSGLGDLIKMMVLISINLGILNMLPFPPLDGGHVLFTSLERVTGRRIFDKRITEQKVFGKEFELTYEEAVFYAGFILIITLMVLVTVQDAVRFGPAIKNFFIELGKGLGLVN